MRSTVPADEEELYHLRERRNILLHRLRLLEKQRDMLGTETPPGTLIQIDNTKQELAIVDLKLQLPQIDPKIAATVTNADPLFAIAQLSKVLTDRFDAGLAEVSRKTGDLATQVQFLTRSHRAAEDWRNRISADVQDLAGKVEGGRARGRHIQIAILVLLVLVLALLLWWMR